MQHPHRRRPETVVARVFALEAPTSRSLGTWPRSASLPLQNICRSDTLRRLCCLANLRRKTGVATQWNPRPISQQEQENSGELFDSEGKALALSPSIVYWVASCARPTL
jgi:hypothetical protein